MLYLTNSPNEMLLRTIQGKCNGNDVCKGSVSCILIAMSRNSISFWFRHKAAVWYLPYMNVTAPAYVPSGILPMFNSSISIRLFQQSIETPTKVRANNHFGQKTNAFRHLRSIRKQIYLILNNHCAIKKSQNLFNGNESTRG